MLKELIAYTYTQFGRQTLENKKSFLKYLRFSVLNRKNTMHQ